jgi:hypothetical protein
MKESWAAADENKLYIFIFIEVEIYYPQIFNFFTY